MGVILTTYYITGMILQAWVTRWLRCGRLKFVLFYSNMFVVFCFFGGLKYIYFIREKLKMSRLVDDIVEYGEIGGCW